MRGLSRVVVLLLLAGATVGCAATGGRAEVTRLPETAPVDVLVQGALDEEVRQLLAALEGKQEIPVAGWMFWRGTIGGRSVAVSRTDLGPLNAATATTLGILTFRPRLVINQGSAGAHLPELRIFDVLVGRATVDFGAFASKPAPAGAGVSLARWQPLHYRLRIDGREQEFKQFPGDEALVGLALSTPYPHGRVLPAVLGSAFEFNNEIDRIDWVHRTYGTSSEDMESASAAGVALGLKTRFLAIRVIGNSAFLPDPPQPISVSYLGQFVIDVIKRIP